MRKKLVYIAMGIILAVLVYKAISFGIEARNSLIAEMKKSGGFVGSINHAENVQLSTLNSNK